MEWSIIEGIKHSFADLGTDEAWLIGIYKNYYYGMFRAWFAVLQGWV